MKMGCCQLPVRAVIGRGISVTVENPGTQSGKGRPPRTGDLDLELHGTTKACLPACSETYRDRGGSLNLPAAVAPGVPGDLDRVAPGQLLGLGCSWGRLLRYFTAGSKMSSLGSCFSFIAGFKDGNMP